MILELGSCEAGKAAYHRALKWGAVGAAAYNAAAFLARRGWPWHLAFNACLYALLAKFEDVQADHHVDRLRGT